MLWLPKEWTREHDTRVLCTLWGFMVGFGFAMLLVLVVVMLAG